MKLEAKSYLRLALVFVIEFTYFAINAKLDPEIHHDGIMLGAAIGVSEGGIPNKDVFTQYGPLTPLLQGLWLYLTEPTLLSIRLFTAIQLALCGALIYWMLKTVLQPFIAVAISFGWSLSYPFFILPINLPWASVLTTLITLISMILLRDIDQRSNAISRVAIASSILTLAIFARIHMLLPLGVVGLFLLLLWRQKRDSKLFKTWIYSSAITLLIAVSLLYLFDALDEYLQQCLLWAFTNYAAPAVGFTKGEIVAMALLLFFPGFLFLQWCLTRIQQSRTSNKLKLLIYSVGIMAVIMLSNTYVEHKSYLNPVYVTVSISQNFPNILGYSSVTLLFLYLWAERKNFSFFRIELLPVAVGMALVPQLYPAHDTLHLYWISPATIISVALYLHYRNPDKLAAQSRTVFPTVISVVIIGLALSTLHLVKPRESYVDPVLRGMVGEEATRKPIDDMLLSLRKLPQESTVEFNCAHGLFAVAGGKYLASDLRFVSWGTKPISKLDYEYKLSCDLTEIEARKLREMENIISEVRLATGQIIQLSKK